MTGGGTREAVLETAKEMSRRGLVEGTAGNVSARVDERLVCMTPSSVGYDSMTDDDLVIVDLDGTVIEGHRSPTTEKALHLACYRRYEEVASVIHSHPVFATMFAVARQPIPARIEEFVVFVGGDVPVCEYTTTGTDELGEVVAERLSDVAAVLLANHGMVTVASSPEKALHVAALVERSAQIIWGARVLGTDHEIPAEVNRNFQGVYKYLRDNRM